MKRLPVFALCVLMGMVAATPASAQETEHLITIEDLVKDRSLWPREVVLKKATQVPVTVATSGINAMVGLPAGTVLAVYSVERERLLVRVGPNLGSVAIADTNVLELANDTYSIPRARQKLIDDANKLPAIPSGESPVVSPTPAPAAVGPRGRLRERLERRELEELSDEFNDAGSIEDWLRVTQTEGWNVNLYNSIEYQNGALVLSPKPSSWYQDYRGELFYHPVDGDFVLETRLSVGGRNTPLPPRRYSFAGLMIRASRNITPETWQRDQEAYLFLGLGVGDSVMQPTFETKITLNSKTNKQETPVDKSDARLKIVRIKDTFLFLARPLGGSWHYLGGGVMQNFGSVQVGFTAYADWDGIRSKLPEDFNRNGPPDVQTDMLAMFDYVRYARPDLKPGDAQRIQEQAQAGTLQASEVLELFGK